MLNVILPSVILLIVILLNGNLPFVILNSVIVHIVILLNVSLPFVTLSNAILFIITLLDVICHSPKRPSPEDHLKKCNFVSVILLSGN
jgi:hypothetical protein